MTRITNEVMLARLDEKLDNHLEFIKKRFNDGEKHFDKINGSIDNHGTRLTKIEEQHKLKHRLLSLIKFW